MLEQNSIRFSVVTVCYNAEDTIQNTIQSVIQQKYDNYEYLIMDGLSSDGTLELLNQYNDSHINLFSEKDTGIYNAMNKATSRCKSDYIIFMNSGDSFYDSNVLRDVAEMIEGRQPDILYGNIIRQYTNYSRLEKYSGGKKVMLLLLMGKMPCHQAIFTRTELMQQFLFDESYSITADYNFIMRCQKQKCSMKYLDRIIGISECEKGISSQTENLELMRQQDDRSMKDIFPIYYFILYPLKWVIRILKKCKR